MADHGTVTIVIPTVNRLAYLREAVASALAQTYPHLEVIVSDNSGNVAYAREVDRLCRGRAHSALRVIHQPEQLSMVGHCNALRPVGTGDFWLYLPDDDWLDPACVERLVAALAAQPGAGIAFCDHWVCDAGGHRLHAHTARNSAAFGRSELTAGLIKHEQLLDVAVRQCFELQSMLFRRTVIRDVFFDERFDCMPDYDLQIRAALSEVTGDAVYVAERLTSYRHHDQQFTGSFHSERLNLQLVELMTAVGEQQGRTEAARLERLARAHRALALSASERGDRARAFKHLRQALRYQPDGWLSSALYAPLLAGPPWTIGMARRGARLVRQLRRVTRAVAASAFARQALVR